MKGRFLELYEPDTIERNERFLRMTTHGAIDTNARHEQIKRNARRNDHPSTYHEKLSSMQQKLVEMFQFYTQDFSSLKICAFSPLQV